MKMVYMAALLLSAALCAAGCGRKEEILVGGIRTRDESAGWLTQSPETGQDTDPSSGVPEETMSPEIAVYVCGAVVNPDVYYFRQGARVCDAIDAAGGFTKEADTQWLNQAQLLDDGQMLTVFTKEETAGMREGSLRADTQDISGHTVSGADAGTGRVNLNTASKEQLMTLPGIGEAKAETIIRYREENGLFSCIEDVMQISGIKDSVFSKIREHITV